MMNNNKSMKKPEDKLPRTVRVQSPAKAPAKQARKPAPPPPSASVRAPPKVVKTPTRGVIHADSHFAPLVLGVHGSPERTTVRRPKDAVFWKPLNKQLQKTYAHLQLPESVFGLSDASTPSLVKRDVESSRMTQGLRDLVQKVVRAYVDAGHAKGLTNQQLADWVKTGGDLGEVYSNASPLFATESSWASIQATLSNLITYSAGSLPAALIGLASGMSVADVLLGLLEALGASSVSSFVSGMASAEQTPGADDSIDYLVSLLVDDVTAGNALTTLQKFNTWVDTYNAAPQKELLTALANAGTSSASLPEGDPRGTAPLSDNGYDGDYRNDKVYQHIMAADAAAERFAGGPSPYRAGTTEYIRGALRKNNAMAAGARQAARDAVRAANSAQNPFSKGTQIGVTASGNEITQIHNRPTSITPLMNQDGLYGMHVTGSQLLCTAGGFTGGQSMVFDYLPGGDGCDLPSTGYLTSKGIAMNPNSLGFMLRELAMNWAQFRIDELELCIGTRVGTSTEGLWVLAYNNDGALPIISPGGGDLTGAIAASMTNATMLNAYTSCGAAQNMGNCWRLPRRTSTNADHWFRIECEREGASNYNTASARDTIDGWICGAQAVDVVTAEDRVWQVVGCKYSISFCDPAFQTFATAARNINNTLGPLIAPGFLETLKDPLLVCGMAWLLGFSLAAEGSPKELEQLVNNMRLLFPGFVPPDATPDTLMPKFFAYQQKLGPPPGIISRCGWKPSSGVYQFSLMEDNGTAQVLVLPHNPAKASTKAAATPGALPGGVAPSGRR